MLTQKNIPENLRDIHTKIGMVLFIFFFCFSLHISRDYTILGKITFNNLLVYFFVWIFKNFSVHLENILLHTALCILLTLIRLDY